MKLSRCNLQTTSRRLPGVLSISLAVVLLGASRVSAEVEPLSFVQTPSASSFFTASITNAFDGVGVALADDWTLEAEAGDRLTVRIETAIGNARPKLRVLNPSGQTLASVDGGTSGIAETYSVLLPVPGAFRVRVYTDQQVSDYRLRVDLTRGPTLEVETNDSINAANLPEPNQLAGSFRFRIAGTLTAADSAGDYFALGTLDVGSEILTELFTGPLSTLLPGDAVVSLFRQGDANAVFQAATNFTYLVSDRDVYFVRITSETHRDLFARYFLTLTITDDVPPSVVGTSLPAEGATSTDIFNSFTVAFAEPMAAATVNNLGNFSLRAAGQDGQFGTSDDDIYPLHSPAYSTGTNVVFALVDGPLQPGNYRFTIAATVTDRAGNPLTPTLTRNFSIERLGVFQFENRDNGAAGRATSLSVSEGSVPDGSYRVE
ncbi:MAG: Ig-like domain-containing protein, partial [Verrucomicrobiae bacterium]|nr:Ig-like domain-containing protein [Verrucomicrobiae bacterium]